MKTKVFTTVIFVALFLLMSTALADELYEITVIPIQDTISLDGTAEFRLVIKNNQARQEKYRIFNDFVEWDIYTVPRTDSTLVVGAKSAVTVSLEARPISFTIREGQYYQVPVSIKATQSGVLKTIILPIGVRSPEFIENIYSPRIDATLIHPAKIDPRQEIIINVDLTNRNPRNFSNLTLQLKSKYVQQEKIVGLEPYEHKVVTFTAKLDPLQRPAEDSLSLYVIYQTKFGNSVTVTKDENNFYEIIGYGDIEATKTETSSFLKTATTYTLRNNANEANKELFKVEAPFLRIFKHPSPVAQVIKEDDQRYYGWDVSLDPQESYTVMIITNYRPLFYLFLLIILCFVLYLLLRSPLVITKSASHIVMKEGGITEMKVIINLKNRSYKNIEDIHVTDKVPQIAEIKKEFAVGTLQPSSIIKHERKGTFVKFRLDGLESYEERVLSYIITSRMSILGQFQLPIAKATFKANGSIRNTSSNRYIFKN